MNALEALYTDNSKDVTYDGSCWVPLKNGKPTRSYMKDWPQEQRTAKFFEFCRAYDKREDSLLRDNYQQFSHRLHWHECPFVDEVSQIDDPVKVLQTCILFSFSNEHWLTHRAWMDGGLEGLMDRVESHRHARSDLFQIYYPKGTSVKKWLQVGPMIGSVAMARNAKLGNQARPYTMMEFAKALNLYFIEQQGFRNAMYASKNAARHVAMTHPEWVDPHSFLHGGTGFFDGLQQVFDCGPLMGKAKYSLDGWSGLYHAESKAAEEMASYVYYLAEHKDSPIKTQGFLNVEDKLCMFFKAIAIHHGIKKTTPKIPYDWIYPLNWSLKTGKYDRIV